MKILEIFRGILQRETTANAGTDSTPEKDTIRGGSTPLWLSPQGGDLSIATVYSCVKLLADSVANLPIRHLTKRGGIFFETENRLNALLGFRPDAAMGAFDFKQQLVKNLLLDGNAYIVPVYSSALQDIDRLVLCSRGTVSHDTTNDIYSVSDSIMGIYGTFYEDEVIHIKYMPGRDPKRGISPLTYARQTTEIVKAGDKETHKRFARGGNPKGVLTNDKSARGPMGMYDNGEIQKASIDIEEELNNGRNIVPVPDAIDFKQFSLSSADMEFLGSRKFEVAEICRFFGVPPTFIFADSSNNYKSTEAASTSFLRALNPLLKNIENEFTRKLIYSGRVGMEKIEFDRRDIHALDLDTKASYETKLLGLGYTINELRAMNNMPPVEGGDIPMCSANLRGLGEIGNNTKSNNDNGKEGDKKGTAE